MRPRQITGWLMPTAAVALVLACGPAQAPAAVCVTVTPGIDLGCRDEQGAPAGGEPTASSEPAGAPKRSRNTFGAVKSPTGEPRMIPQLPFTGLGLLLVALLGLALLATGLTTRARTRLSSV